MRSLYNRQLGPFGVSSPYFKYIASTLEFASACEMEGAHWASCSQRAFPAIPSSKTGPCHFLAERLKYPRSLFCLAENLVYACKVLELLIDKPFRVRYQNILLGIPKPQRAESFQEEICVIPRLSPTEHGMGLEPPVPARQRRLGRPLDVKPFGNQQASDQPRINTETSPVVRPDDVDTRARIPT